MLPALQLPGRVGRDIRDDVDRRPLHVGEDELGGEGSHLAEPALLPAADERPSRPAVGNGCAGGREGRPMPGALAAAPDGPRGRGAAAATAGSAQRPQLEQASRTERVCCSTAGDAASRQEKIDQPRKPR